MFQLSQLNLLPWLRRRILRAQRRILRGRAGSVLIIVVTLLVLLALMGTAYISLTRIDRIATSAYVETAGKEAFEEELTELVIGAVQDKIVEDFFLPEHWDGRGTIPSPNDTWLMNRLPVPQLVGPSVPPELDNAELPLWLTISEPLGGVNDPGFYESPLSIPLMPPLAGEVSTTYPPVDGTERIIPTFVQITYPNTYPEESMRGKTRTFPGLRSVNNGGLIFTPSATEAFLAADADGDGIADAGLYRLTLTSVDGVHYYAAIRIIDNNSAININTAWMRGNDVDPVTGSLTLNNLGMFSGNIGLLELLDGSADMDRLNEFRFNGLPVANLEPVDDTPAARSDFDFISGADALHMQLGRRLDNPGYLTTGVKYQALPATDSADMAYRFLTLQDPYALLVDRNNSDAALFDSIVGIAPNYVLNSGSAIGVVPYFPANKEEEWFDHLNYDAGPTKADGTFRSVRPLLTTHNPVANTILKFVNDKFDWNRDDSVDSDLGNPGMAPYTNNPDDWVLATTYGLYDVVSFTPDSISLPPLPEIAPRSYLSLVSGNTGNQPNTNPDEWVPISSGLAKTSMNTAGFEDLWRGFWNVMAEKAANSSAPGRGTATQFDEGYRSAFATDPSLSQWYTPYLGNTFDPATFSVTGPEHLLRMFRSSLRDPRSTSSAPFTSTNPATRFTSFQQMMLRSALAAINLVALRDPSNNVPSRTFTLYETAPTDPDWNLSTTYAVGIRVIYPPAGSGLAQGIFESLVNANVNHKPFGDPDSATYWQPVPSTITPQYEVTVYGAKPQPYITEVFANTETTSNPNGYIAIELHNPYPTPISLTNWRLAILNRQAASLPAPSAAPSPSPQMQLTEIPFVGGTIPAGGFAVVTNGAPSQPVYIGITGTPIIAANLHLAFDHELVLLRPRIAGVAEPNIYDMVPVDSYDFTGLQLNPLQFEAWHYVRANDTTAGRAWQFVYPGRYDGSQGVFDGTLTPPRVTARQQGTQSSGIWPTASEPDDPWIPPATTPPAPAVNLGAADGDSSYSDLRFVLPLNMPGWPGPNPAAASGNLFPFGGFARNGDILQVPFIGAYRVRELQASTTLPPLGEIDPGDLVNASNVLVELNSITMDAAFAEDTDDNDDPQSGDNGLQLREQIGRFCPLFATTGGVGTPGEHYDWAEDIFDYFAVQTPHDDYLPNTDPTVYTAAGAPDPQAVANGDSLANDIDEETTPIQGLINVNTAQWKVLAMLPLVVDASGVVDVVATEELAKEIVAYREANGPFKNLFELNKVKDSTGNFTFENLWGKFSTNTDADDGQGDFSPIGLSNLDNVTKTFEEKYLQITRLSNLLTTRSDSFTCYIVLQGWRNAGGEQGSTTNPPPMLVWEKRLAFIADRSQVTSSGDKPRIIPIPTK